MSIIPFGSLGVGHQYTVRPAFTVFVNVIVLPFFSNVSKVLETSPKTVLLSHSFGR